jgi:hypothetical protein
VSDQGQRPFSDSQDAQSYRRGRSVERRPHEPADLSVDQNFLTGDQPKDGVETPSCRVTQPWDLDSQMHPRCTQRTLMIEDDLIRLLKFSQYSR